MKSILTAFLSLTLMAMMVACGNKSTVQETTTQQQEVIDTIRVDTVAIQREAAKTRDSLSTNCTAQQAIDYMKTSGYWTEYSNGIIPDIVTQHLPYARKLINNKHDYFIIVDKGSMMVILYDKYGQQKLSYKMACGRNYGHKRQKADCRTPEGFFHCQGVFDSTDWLYTNDYGVTSPVRGQFGPRFIRVCPQIGIHGTGARYSIGRRCSHGCIRIQNENIMILHKYAKKGMPIIVNPGPNDVKANKKNGVSMPVLTIPNLPIVQAQAMEAEKEAAKIKAESAKANAATKTDSTTTIDTSSTQAPAVQGETVPSKSEPITEEAPETSNTVTPAPETPKQAPPMVQPKVDEPKSEPKQEPKAEPAPATSVGSTE